MFDDVFYVDVKLNTGETAQVSIDDLQDFLDNNRDRVVDQYRKPRRRRISASIASGATEQTRVLLKSYNIWCLFIPIFIIIGQIDLFVNILQTNLNIERA